LPDLIVERVVVNICPGLAGARSYRSSTAEASCGTGGLKGEDVGTIISA
jgi:hypothetical protein